MDDWKEIKSQQDIDELIDEYGGFHDGCLVSANFHSGAGVDDDLRMGFGDVDDYTLHVTFERQERPKRSNSISLGCAGVTLSAMRQIIFRCCLTRSSRL